MPGTSAATSRGPLRLHEEWSRLLKSLALSVCKTDFATSLLIRLRKHPDERSNLSLLGSVVCLDLLCLLLVT
jgi:hypothetical protein